MLCCKVTQLRGYGSRENHLFICLLLSTCDEAFPSFTEEKRAGLFIQTKQSEREAYPHLSSQQNIKMFILSDGGFFGERHVSISHMFEIKDHLLNDCRTYPNVVYGLATGTGLVKLG